MPVIVHLLPTHGLAELTSMVRSLESTEGLLGVEIGLPPEVDSATARELAQAASSSELPVIVRLPLEHAVELARAVSETGIAAISLGPPRGMLPGLNGKPVAGRLYGPATYPLVLATVLALAQFNLPVIGGGGIYQAEQVETLLNAGAVAVQVDQRVMAWLGLKRSSSNLPAPASFLARPTRQFVRAKAFHYASARPYPAPLDRSQDEKSQPAASQLPDWFDLA